ncbi:hypothetical protein CH371_01355 [Leptospira wolffii]|uniref:Uncharacterized protein n=1 Tax=Leptospira wolffii TaxID=409998 RepID=A0A2M9ZEB5_9LEPT|nr:hypothetical protein CH371_01355 [Leptospira wolffii]
METIPIILFLSYPIFFQGFRQNVSRQLHERKEKKRTNFNRIKSNLDRCSLAFQILPMLAEFFHFEERILEFFYIMCYSYHTNPQEF